MSGRGYVLRPVLAVVQTAVTVGVTCALYAPPAMTVVCVVSVLACGLCCWMFGACQGMKETRELYGRLWRDE